MCQDMNAIYNPSYGAAVKYFLSEQSHSEGLGLEW